MALDHRQMLISMDLAQPVIPPAGEALLTVHQVAENWQVSQRTRYAARLRTAGSQPYIPHHRAATV